MSDQLKTERISLHLQVDKILALKKLAAKNGTDLSKEIRSAVDSYLDIEVSADNINLVTNVIRQELAGQIKSQTNRLAALLNRNTIISAAAYYATIAIISDLIDTDRYSTFEKIESIARKKALAYANTKNSEALSSFMNDIEIQRAIEEIKGNQIM